ASTAVVAVGAISEGAAPAEAESDQVPVDPRIDQVAGCGDLRACRAIRQIAARIGCSRIELQRRQRQVVELGHGSSGAASAASVQLTAGAVDFTKRASQPPKTLRVLCRAPHLASCSV